jgi:hypothetical protein
MYRIAILLSCLAVGSSACTRHHRAARLDPHEFPNKGVTVRTRDGQTERVHAETRNGVLVWLDEDGQEVPARDVERVERVSRARGFVQGLGIGALTGIGVGIAAGLADGDDPPCDDDDGWFCLRFDADEKAVMGGAFFGGVGFVVGGLVGLIAGSTDVYERPSSSHSAIPRVSIRPVAGSGASTSLSWSF